MRPLNEIIIHCAATSPDWMKDAPIGDKVAEIDRWHKDRGWSGIGYHYVIDRSGVFSKGRPLDKVGAHVKGHNTGTVGICLIGGHGSSAGDKFDDHFTEDQEQSLKRLILDLRNRFPNITKISGHNQYAAKACPGFSVPDWVAQKPAQEMRPPVRSQERTSPVQSTTVQASALQIASGAGAGIAALGSLSGTAQVVALGFAGIVVLAGLYIMRERLRKWSAGNR